MTGVRSVVMTSGWKRPLQLAAACWAAFGLLLVAAYWLPFGKWADGWAVNGFLNLQRPWLDGIATFVAKLVDPGPFALWTVGLAAVALYRKRPRHALAVILLLGGANLLTQVLKLLLAHPRHHAFLGDAQISANAFPSGHATASMALALAAILVAPQAWRPLVALAGAIFAVAVSESLMLLAWHFPSDVAGGYLVATSAALTTLAALRGAEQRWPERTGRDAARRAIRLVDPKRAALTVGGFVVAALAGLAVAAGERAFHFADHHTTAAAAAVAVAAMAAALPLAVAALGARRL
jgi:membrane-associated phospholipid phosphatase